MMGTHVSTRTARNGTDAYLLGNVLVATREGWEASLKLSALAYLRFPRPVCSASARNASRSKCARSIRSMM
jgi:hypothetical protein